MFSHIKSILWKPPHMRELPFDIFWRGWLSPCLLLMLGTGSHKQCWSFGFRQYISQLDCTTVKAVRQLTLQREELYLSHSLEVQVQDQVLQLNDIWRERGGWRWQSRCSGRIACQPGSGEEGWPHLGFYTKWTLMRITFPGHSPSDLSTSHQGSPPKHLSWINSPPSQYC